MENQEMKEIVYQYFKAYSEFDVQKMGSFLHDDVEFKNISNGEVTLALNGKTAFINQAKHAVNLFEKRKIKVKSFTFEDEFLDVKLDFMGILAVDVPEDHKKGDKIEMEGRSRLKFSSDKIISIEDIN